MSLTDSTNVADVCVENSLSYSGWRVVPGITTMAAVGMLLLPAYRYTTNLTQDNSSSSEPESFLTTQKQEHLLKATEQAPMYLPEVEANPQPSPYADLIRVAKDSGREHWQIWNLFAFRPEVTSHLASFTEGVMRAPAPVSGGLRELIAAYTSWTNFR